MERLELDWQREKQKHGPQQALVPSFARLLPVSPKKDYEQRRNVYETACAATRATLTDQLNACEKQRTEKLQSFQRANQARERQFDRARDKQKVSQQQSFVRDVRNEQTTANGKMREEFARNGRVGPVREQACR